MALTIECNAYYKTFGTITIQLPLLKYTHKHDGINNI